MSYYSFVLTPVTSSGCDGWHCSGWLGGGAEVQQINAVEMMQNIYFLTFNTYVNIAMWRVLLVGQGVSYTASAQCQISFFHILHCGVAMEGKCGYRHNSILRPTPKFFFFSPKISWLTNHTDPPCSPRQREPDSTVLPKQIGPQYLL